MSSAMDSESGTLEPEDRKRNAERILSSALCRIVSYRIVSYIGLTGYEVSYYLDSDRISS